MKQFIINVEDDGATGITAARLLFNASLPAEVQDGVDGDGNPVMVPNPGLLATDEAYVQKRFGVDAPASYYDATQHIFRIPTGEWMQRWTAEEKKRARAIGAGLVAGVGVETAAQVQSWLDRIDVAPIVNLLQDADVTNGVPQLCALLEQLGTIPAGQGAARAAAINALKF